MPKDKKKKTLRNKKTSSKPKKTYFGGQSNNDFLNEKLYASFTKTYETKNELFEIIKKEGSHLFDLETSNKIRSLEPRLKEFSNSLNYDGSTLGVVRDMQTSVDTLEEKRLTLLDHYGKSYETLLTMSFKIQEELMNNLEIQNNYIKNILNMFYKNEIYIHFLELYFDRLTFYKNNISKIEKDLIAINQKIKAIFDFIEDDYKEKQEKQQKSLFKIKEREAELESAISTVLMTIPPNAVVNTKFIQGCPYGAKLEGDSCVFYDISNNKVGDSVAFQKDLVDETSDIVVWFENPSAKPKLFERKSKMYVLNLTAEDQTYFNAKYVVCESNGALKEDKFANYSFIGKLECCYNDAIPEVLKMENPANGYDYYILDDMNLPQSVEILDKTAQQIHTTEAIEKFLKLTTEEDQITIGIQFVETSNDGTLLLDKNKNIIPFFPEIEEFRRKENVFTKNNIRYKILENKLTESIYEKLDVSIRPKKMIFNFSTINQNTSNIFDKIYTNSIVQINLPKLFKPFVLPFVLQNENDFFLIENTSDSIPIIFELSKDSKEKRVVVYPKQFYIFVFSKASPILHYGFLHFPINPDVSYRSNKTSLVNNTYVFVSGEDYNLTPLLDTENLLIPVPNIHKDESIYYEYDDLFEKIPLKIKLYNNAVQTNQTIFSTYHKSYKSDYVSKIDNMYIFCDKDGNANLDIFGYVIPLPYPIREENNTYLWDKNIVQVLKPYEGNATFDLNNTIQPSVIVGGGNISESHLKSLLDKLSIYKQIVQNLIDFYKDVNTSINNFSDIYLQLNTIYLDLPKQNNNQEVDIMFKKGEDIYNEAMKTKDAIDLIKKQDTTNKKIQEETDSLREKYKKQLAVVLQNETNLQTKLVELENNIQTLDENIDSSQLKLDLDELKELFNDSKESRLLLNKNVDTTNDIDLLNSQEDSIITLLNTDIALESQINALDDSVEKAKINYRTMLIQTNQKMLEEYKKQILNEKNNIDLLRDLYSKTLNEINEMNLDTQFSDTVETKKKDIELEFSNIEQMIEKTREPIASVLTDYDIKQLTDRSISYILEIQNEKKKIKENIKILKDVSNKSAINKIATKKQSLYDYIKSLQTKKQFILNILKSIVVDNKEILTQLSQLDTYETEIKTIQLNINESSDMNDLQEYEKELLVIENEFDIILTQVQAFEYSMKSSSTGGKRRTRKFPKNLVIRN
jgi:hypothetical protein